MCGRGSETGKGQGGREKRSGAWGLPPRPTLSCSAGRATGGDGRDLPFQARGSGALDCQDSVLAMGVTRRPLGAGRRRAMASPHSTGGGGKERGVQPRGAPPRFAGPATAQTPLFFWPSLEAEVPIKLCVRGVPGETRPEDAVWWSVGQQLGGEAAFGDEAWPRLSSEALPPPCRGAHSGSRPTRGHCPSQTQRIVRCAMHVSWVAYL